LWRRKALAIGARAFQFSPVQRGGAAWETKGDHMTFMRNRRGLTSIGAAAAIFGAWGVAGCNDAGISNPGVESVRSTLDDIPPSDPDAGVPEDPPTVYDPEGEIATTLAPVRKLDEVPGNVSMRSFAETFPGTGTFHHEVHVYQPDGTGEALSFELSAKDAGGSVDGNHWFRSVTLTSHPGLDDQRQRPFPDAAGSVVYAHPTSRVGWYRLTFDYVAPNPGRTFTFKAVDSAGNPLKIMWSDPSGANVQVVATVVVDQESPAFLKGGGYRNATTGEYAFVDNVTVDGQLLYRDGFDQGQFNFPLGRLSAATHTVAFSFSTSGTNPSYLWYGINDRSFDSFGVNNQWAPLQFLYRGPMHSGDYDAWNEGVAFAQGPNLTFGVRPPVVRRGTTVALALEHASLRYPWTSADLRIYPAGSSTRSNWTVSKARDYNGGIFTPAGFSARYREHWLLSVPSDAPVGKYVVRAFTPQGASLGPDVMFYVIHNPYPSVQSGRLSKPELETYAYDEDEDGMPMQGSYGPDEDHARDHFTSEVDFFPSEGYWVSTRLDAAFRRTGGPTAYSMLDYAVAVVEGTPSEFESMRRLFRLVAQYLNYTRPNLAGDATDLLGVATSPASTFTPEIAAQASQPGFAITPAAGAECFDYAFLLASLARTSGITARAVSGGSIAGFGHHQFTEAFIPDLPHHGGYQSASGGLPSDQDPWYVFDATTPFPTEAGEGLQWLTHGEAIAPRAMYAKATVEVRSLLDPPILWEVFTADVDWTPKHNEWIGYKEAWTLPADQVLNLGNVYSSGPEHWLTRSGATGFIGFSDKDVYRINMEATGASAVEVSVVASGGSQLHPVLCIAPVTAGVPAFPEMCDNPGASVTLPPGDSYVVVFNGTPQVLGSRMLRGDSIQYQLSLTYDGTPCNEASAVDMGVPGTTVHVANNGCLKVTQYPSWWGVRQMQVQNMDPGTYPVPFTWSNCGTSGSDTIARDWQSFYINGISAACTTLIKLNGTGSGSVNLRYYAM
jgi:hypothetical protein